MRLFLLATVLSVALLGCNDSSDEAPDTAMPTGPDGGAGDGSTPTAEDTADVPGAVIPQAAQGRWGLVPADCTSTRGDAKGLLVVSPTTLTFYESVGTLGTIAERSDSRIRAQFAFNGEGMSWMRDEMLDVRDGGKTLIRREYGDDAAPGPLKYTRCS